MARDTRNIDNTPGQIGYQLADATGLTDAYATSYWNDNAGTHYMPGWMNSASDQDVFYLGTTRSGADALRYYGTETVSLTSYYGNTYLSLVAINPSGSFGASTPAATAAYDVTIGEYRAAAGFKFTPSLPTGTAPFVGADGVLNLPAGYDLYATVSTTGSTPNPYIVTTDTLNYASTVASMQVSGTSPDPSNGAAVYRLYNTANGEHFYTGSSAERNSAFGTTMTLEGTAYKSAGGGAENSTNLYRFANNATGTHFYTASKTERDLAIQNGAATMTYEGIAYRVYDPSLASTGGLPSGAIPVYRFYDTNSRSHFFTSSSTERDLAIINGRGVYNYEGIGFYVANGTMVLPSSMTAPDEAGMAANLQAAAVPAADAAAVGLPNDAGAAGALTDASLMALRFADPAAGRLSEGGAIPLAGQGGDAGLYALAAAAGGQAAAGDVSLLGMIRNGQTNGAELMYG